MLFATQRYSGFSNPGKKELLTSTFKKKTLHIGINVPPPFYAPH